MGIDGTDIDGLFFSLLEFLPRVLGGHVMDGFGLRLLPSGFYQDYDSDCSASIFNEFATAAFRCGLN